MLWCFTFLNPRRREINPFEEWSIDWQYKEQSIGTALIHKLGKKFDCCRFPHTEIQQPIPPPPPKDKIIIGAPSLAGDSNLHNWQNQVWYFSIVRYHTGINTEAKTGKLQIPDKEKIIKTKRKKTTNANAFFYLQK